MDFLDKFSKKHKPKADVLTTKTSDRRLLSHVPDPEGVRTNQDRRGSAYAHGEDINERIRLDRLGQRYVSDFKMKIRRKGSSAGADTLRCANISGTGALLLVDEWKQYAYMPGVRVTASFTIPNGTMPDGFEGAVRISGKVVRTNIREDGLMDVGIAFDESLEEYLRKRKDRWALLVSSIMLAVVAFFILMMRAESVIYFRFNRWLYLYSLIAAFFLLSRYLLAIFYKPVPINPDYTPGVSIIIPCFNEEEWIQTTILGCMDQDYPPDKLEVIVVDDCSTDKSVEKIEQIVNQLRQEQRFDTANRISYVVQPHNAGKRHALVRGAEMARHELVVFVDSDSFLDPYAIRNLVQPFQDNKIGGVTGRTDVANAYTNALTKMQTVRYYIAFRIMKAAESVFDAVTCLSGPISCYRKEIILRNSDAWLNQKFLGQPATFGDDRAMTNIVLRKYRTCYQDTAICSTIVPTTQRVFLKQQMRWKRSWLRESIQAGTFIWKKEPLASLNFYIGLLVPILAPVVVIYNLLYVPIVHKVFPTTFLVGLLLMSLMMSFAQLLLRKSKTWLFGLLFCVYYEAVLLWQMPIAWFTFWKSTWGTRMTPSDVEEQERKKQKEAKRHKGKEHAHV